jgi:hypothetical protein
MAMIPADLAEAIRSQMGLHPPVSNQLIAWATGIITSLTTDASVSNAIGTVVGIAPPSPGALTLGAANGGKIAGLLGSSMANYIIAADPKDYPYLTPQLSGMCDGIAQHIVVQATITFAIGTINGACTNTLISPGVFVGTGAGGTVSGLDGSGMANLVVSQAKFPNVTPELLNKCTAIANYIMAHAIVSYSTVTGTCSAGGGSLIAGIASGGRIT